MTYSVKELFYTLQGEGAQSGRASVFLRFSGCNLWSGREQDRSSAACHFCDTDFIGTNGLNGGKFTSAEDLATAAFEIWPGDGVPYIVCTGGEPLLQMDTLLINALHDKGFEVAIETNGTLSAPENIDWICVSPKAANKRTQKSGDELKLVFPQKEAEAHPSKFESLTFDHFYLQPLDVIGDTETSKNNIQEALEYCLKNPKWQLSLQTHKMVGFA